MSKKFSMITLALAMCALTSTGCTRAFTDGVLSGITNGTAGAIATLMNSLISGVIPG